MRRFIWIFGYGSLASPSDIKRFASKYRLKILQEKKCFLFDYRRVWNIAFVNDPLISSYKYYVDRLTHEPYQGGVTFLNVIESPGHYVNGTALKINIDDCDVFMRRERNYDQIDITHQTDLQFGEPVYTFVGKPEARACFDKLSKEGRCVISRNYKNLVEMGFQERGIDVFQRYIHSTEKPSVPVADLALVRT